MKRRLNPRKGFTLVEVVIGIGVFAIVAVSIYGIIASMFSAIKYEREHASVAALADRFMEIARNLPYSQVGTLGGNPHGSLPDFANASTTTVGSNTYQLYYEVTYVDDPADGTIAAGTDPAPNDYKQVKLFVKNMTTGIITDFVTTIVPSSLESLSSGGALAIKVFNAVGQPVPNAQVSIVNNALSPSLNLSRQSDASGNWTEVGLPDSSNSYHVVVTKSGYSTDATYPITGQNPNPVKPDGTILNGQATQVSFSIDQLSNVTFHTLNQTCQPLPSVGLEVRGAKLIGTPNVYKFDNTYTSDANGLVPLTNIEWDNYTPMLTSPSSMIYGSYPIQQVAVLPNTSQDFSLIVGPATANSLLVIVKDAATGNPIEGATVDLQTISPAGDTYETTGGSIWNQESWAGGAGQALWSDPTMYFSDDGGVSASGVPAGLRLLNTGSAYVPSGTLTSSAFDTGTVSTSYTTLTWQPTSQDPATAVQFQVATNNDNATWNFVGPDGTANTYYTTSGSSISATNNNNRYVRYRVTLSTSDSSKTPVLTGVNLNYVSGCFTPGQVMFPGLAAGANYNVVVSMTGYQTQTISSVNINGYSVLTVLLSQ